MQDHNNLRVFDLTDRLAMEIYGATAEFPASEKFGLRSQIRRAAVSVPTNIVEGCARETNGELARFLDIAFGSIRELEYLLSLSHRLGYFDEDAYRQLEKLRNLAAGGLAKLRRKVRAHS